MSATYEEKILALNDRHHATAMAGINLVNDVETMLSYNGLTADEMRKYLETMVEDFRRARADAIKEYEETGRKLGEL